MRILHVIQELRTGGAEQIVVSVARGAREAGHELAVAAVPGPLAEQLGLEPFPLPMLRRRPWLVPGAALRLLGVLRAWRPDVVHCHNPGMAVVTAQVFDAGHTATLEAVLTLVVDIDACIP